MKKTEKRDMDTSAEEQPELQGKQDAAEESVVSGKEPVKEAGFQEEEKETVGDQAGALTADDKADENGEDLKSQLDAQKDRYLRLMAEFDNYKRRTNREFGRLIETANEELILKIIEVRESFERALDIGEKSSEYEKFFEGMKLIFSKLNDVLGKSGLEVFAEIGEQFNPEIHDAMMKMPHETIPEDHIAQIYEKGYRLKSRVIKHAKVVVSSGASEELADEIESECERTSE